MRSSKHRPKRRSPARLNRSNDHRGPTLNLPQRGFRTGVPSLLILCLLLAAAANLRAQETGQLTISAAAGESYSGILRVRLARNASEYAGETQAYLEKAVPMDGESATVTFQDVDPGQYAVAVYLDGNENGELDTNLFGAPKEPIGFSRNPRIGMSRPGFGETVIEYTGGDVDVDIELKD